MPDVTFEYDDAKITVREQTGRDFFRLETLQATLQAAYRESIAPMEMQHWLFADCNQAAPFILRSTVSGNLGFKFVPYETATHKQFAVMVKGLAGSPLALIEPWSKALAKADLEVPDPEELPGAEKSSKTSPKESPAG